MRNSSCRPADSWRQRLLLYDKLTLAYLVLLPLLMLISKKRAPYWPFVALLHLVLLMAILMLVRYESAISPRLRWLRQVYPLLLFTFFFSIVGRQVNVIFPYWFEPVLLQTDRWLFRDYPWVIFSRRLDYFSVEALAFAYWSYYALIPFGIFLHYWNGRGRAGVAGTTGPTYSAVMARLCLVMYVCYAFFLLMPARGPHDVLHLSHDALFSGGLFYDLVLLVQKYGSVVGAAFPSSHVAAAWIVWLTLRHDFKAIFWVLSPIVILLSISTFAIQFHYVLDAIAGIILAITIDQLMRHRETHRENRAAAVTAVISRAEESLAK